MSELERRAEAAVAALVARVVAEAGALPEVTAVAAGDRVVAAGPGLATRLLRELTLGDLVGLGREDPE